MLNDFPRLNFNDENPNVPHHDVCPHPFGKPPLTSQELAYEAMRKVNSIIADVVKFEERMRIEFDTFIKTDNDNDTAFKQTVTEAFDLFTSTVTQEVNNFQTSCQASYELFKNGMESDFAQLANSLETSYSTFKEEIDSGVLAFKQSVNNQITDQDATVAEAVAYMKDNIDSSTREIFNEKISDGSMTNLLANMFGNSVVYMGADTANNIQQKAGDNGDIWYATDTGVYYQRTREGWISIGSGDKGYAEVLNARSTANNLSERLRIERAVNDCYVSLGYNKIPEFGDCSVTFPDKASIIIVMNGQRLSIPTTQLLSDLPSNTIDDGKNIVCNIPNANALVYNLSSQKYEVREKGAVEYDDILLYLSYNVNAYGKLVESFNFLTARELRPHIDNVAAYALVYNNKTFAIEKVSGGVNIDVGDGFYVVTPYYRDTISKEFIAEQLPENVSVNENGNTIIYVPDNKYLLYDHNTNELTLFTSYNAKSKGKLLLYCSYYNNDFGVIYDACQLKFVHANKNSANIDIQLHYGDTNRVKIEQAVNGNGEAYVNLHFSDGFYVVCNGRRKTYREADIATALGEACTLHENGFTIHLANNNTLLYDVVSEKLTIGKVTEVSPTQSILYACYNKNDYGVLYNKVHLDIVHDSENQLKNLQEEFNSAVLAKDYGWREVCERYAKNFNNTDVVESFLFFTDPHLCHGKNWETACYNYIKYLQKVYNSTPTEFIVCGGDWLGSDDTQSEACFKLGYIDGFMRSMFDNYHHVVGNHDTNYQGVIEEGADPWSGTLTNNTLENLWFRDTGRMYYKFKGAQSDCYVFDTQLDSVDAMTPYKWEQIKWFGDRLIADDSANSIVFLHIAVALNEGTVLGTMATIIGQIIEAYNARTPLNVGDYGFDFRNCKGKIRFVMAGHTHEDYTLTLGGAPLIVTTQLREGGVPTFDLCLADYTNNKLHLTRAGSGESRTVDI